MSICYLNFLLSIFTFNYYFNKKRYNTTNLKCMSFDTDEIITHGDIKEVLELYHLGDNDILEELKKLCKD